MRPRVPRVCGFVDAVSVAHRIAQRRLARAGVDQIGVRRRDGDRADRGDRLRVEHRRPRAARVGRFPHAAVHRAEIELVRPARHAADRVDASAAEWPERPPSQAGVERRVDRLLLRRRRSPESRKRERQKPERGQRSTHECSVFHHSGTAYQLRGYLSSAESLRDEQPPDTGVFWHVTFRLLVQRPATDEHRCTRIKAI